MTNLYDIPLIIANTPNEPKKTNKKIVGNNKNLTIKSYVNNNKNVSDAVFVERATNFTEEQIKEALKLRESLKKQKSRDKVKTVIELENFRTSLKEFLVSEPIFKTLFKYPKKQALMLKSTLDNKHYRFIFELKPR